MKMNDTTFVYGSELQGRGYTTTTDIVFGIVATTVGAVAWTGGILNLYLITKLKVFHSAFGFFWVVRTIGELGTDVTFALYTGPVTILQPTNIPPIFGILANQISYTFAYMQCAMNLVIALNRFVAVWLPAYYKRIYHAKLCTGLVIYACCQALTITSLFFIFPCQLIGYSPKFYANVFVKCLDDPERNESTLSTSITKVCFTIACVGTAVVNLGTFFKIAHIRMSAGSRGQNVQYKRDVNLFFLGVVQDVLMTVVIMSIILCNNQNDLSIVSVVISYDSLVLIYCFNTASMVFCNPECRRFLFGGRALKVTSLNTSNAIVTGTSSATKRTSQSQMK